MALGHVHHQRLALDHARTRDEKQGGPISDDVLTQLHDDTCWWAWSGLEMGVLAHGRDQQRADPEQREAGEEHRDHPVDAPWIGGIRR